MTVGQKGNKGERGQTDDTKNNDIARLNENTLKLQKNMSQQNVKFC